MQNMFAITTYNYAYQFKYLNPNSGECKKQFGIHIVAQTNLTLDKIIDLFVVKEV